jgi:hypothetical protein
MTAPTTLSELAAEWAAARVLHPLYTALAREFVIEVPACADLDEDVDSPSQETVEAAQQWLRKMDASIQVHQLRQFLQTTALASDQALGKLLEHHLHQEKRTDSDRDKIDFLLVQYFSCCTPSQVEEQDVDLEYVAQILEPVFKADDLTLPEWLHPLDQLIAAANQAESLSDLLNGAILEQGRKLKVSSGEQYYQPVAMVAFARFSFLIRRVFFRLMHRDLNAILDGLRELEQRGVNTLDCRSAEFSSEEPTMRLRMICQSWKVMFHAEYSSGQPLRMLVDLHAVVETALKGKAGAGSPRTGARTPKASAAKAGFATPSSGHTEFEVSSGPAWDPKA